MYYDGYHCSGIGESFVYQWFISDFEKRVNLLSIGFHFLEWWVPDVVENHISDRQIGEEELLTQLFFFRVCDPV